MKAQTPKDQEGQSAKLEVGARGTSGPSHPDTLSSGLTHSHPLTALPTLFSFLSYCPDFEQSPPLPVSSTQRLVERMGRRVETFTAALTQVVACQCNARNQAFCVPINMENSLLKPLCLGLCFSCWPVLGGAQGLLGEVLSSSTWVNFLNGLPQGRVSKS